VSDKDTKAASQRRIKRLRASDREATLAAEADVADILHDVVVWVDNVVVLQLAANVVRWDERLGDARAVPHRDVEWIAVAIGDPIEAFAPTAPGSTGGIDALHRDGLLKRCVAHQQGPMGGDTIVGTNVELPRVGHTGEKTGKMQSGVVDGKGRLQLSGCGGTEWGASVSMGIDGERRVEVGVVHGVR
jgi:hypothetical protein